MSMVNEYETKLGNILHISISIKQFKNREAWDFQPLLLLFRRYPWFTFRSPFFHPTINYRSTKYCGTLLLRRTAHTHIQFQRHRNETNSTLLANSNFASETLARVWKFLKCTADKGLFLPCDNCMVRYLSSIQHDSNSSGKTSMII